MPPSNDFHVLKCDQPGSAAICGRFGIDREMVDGVLEAWTRPGELASMVGPFDSDDKGP